LLLKNPQAYIAKFQQMSINTYGYTSDKREFGRRLCLKTYQQLSAQQIYDFLKELEFDGWLPWSGESGYCNAKMVGVKKYVSE
jgi:SMC interacting uncharacterized protein involved in chromosome segregation